MKEANFRTLTWNVMCPRSQTAIQFCYGVQLKGNYPHGNFQQHWMTKYGQFHNLKNLLLGYKLVSGYWKVTTHICSGNWYDHVWISLKKHVARILHWGHTRVQISSQKKLTTLF